MAASDAGIGRCGRVGGEESKTKLASGDYFDHFLFLTSFFHLI